MHRVHSRLAFGTEIRQAGVDGRIRNDTHRRSRRYPEIP